MKTYARYAIAAFAAGLGIFLFYLCASAWGSLISAKNRMQFYLEQPVSIRDARETEQQIEEEQRKSVQEDTEAMPEFCIWGQKEQVILTNDNLSRSIQADMILLCGNPELLFEDCRVPDRKDGQGCLVDEETAWELFGSFEVTGEKISYEGNSYIIRKVISGKERIFALQAAALAENSPSGERQSENGAAWGSPSDQEKNNDVLNRITMQKPEGKSVRDLELAWAIHGLSAVTLDLELLRGIGGFFVLLVPATLCIYFLWYLYRQYREEKQIAWKAATVIMGLVLSVCFLLLLKNQVAIPDDYIPARWSEFSFWTELWNEKQEAIRLMLQIPKTIPDYGWMDAFGRTLGFGLLAELFVVLSSSMQGSLPLRSQGNSMRQRL